MPKDFIQEIPLFNNRGISVYIYRLDLLQPEIQGNKYFKLKYNLAYAKAQNAAILTMGGAHSNHLHATALACKKENIPCFAFIRGKEFKELTPTLQMIQNEGMHLIFLDYDSYRAVRNATSNQAIEEILKANKVNLQHPFHFVTEGASNTLGLQGAKEILDDIETNDFDIYVCPVGSGGTLSGLINKLNGQKKVLGISALKDNYLKDTIAQYTQDIYTNWSIDFNYHFGGFGKWNTDLIDFINEFKEKTQIPLCPIYTGKMMYAVQDLIKSNQIPDNTKILCIHTGGLQGIKGFNARFNNLIKD